MVKMENLSFSQRRFFEKLKIVLDEDHILVKETSLLKSHKYKVFYEAIPVNPQEITTSN